MNYQNKLVINRYCKTLIGLRLPIIALYVAADRHTTNDTTFPHLNHDIFNE